MMIMMHQFDIEKQLRYCFLDTEISSPDSQQVTASDVSDLLRDMGLEEAALYAMDQEINGETIALTPDNEINPLLIEMGLTSACDRLRFITLFYRKINNSISDKAKACPPAEVKQFFEDTRGLQMFTKVIFYLIFDFKQA